MQHRNLIFEMGYDADPEVPTNLVVNHVYADTIPGVAILLFMRGDQFSNVHYFAGDSLAADEVPPGSAIYKTYCQVVFSKDVRVTTGGENVDLLDGIISGYQTSSYGMSNPNKYLQRWDFNISFTALAYKHN